MAWSWEWVYTLNTARMFSINTLNHWASLPPPFSIQQEFVVFILCVKYPTLRNEIISAMALERKIRCCPVSTAMAYLSISHTDIFPCTIQKYKTVCIAWGIAAPQMLCTSYTKYRENIWEAQNGHCIQTKLSLQSKLPQVPDFDVQNVPKLIKMYNLLYISNQCCCQIRAMAFQQPNLKDLLFIFLSVWHTIKECSEIIWL